MPTLPRTNTMKVRKEMRGGKHPLTESILIAILALIVQAFTRNSESLAQLARLSKVKEAIPQEEQ